MSPASKIISLRNKIAVLETKITTLQERVDNLDQHLYAHFQPAHIAQHRSVTQAAVESEKISLRGEMEDARATIKEYELRIIAIQEGIARKILG